jgi:trk system potassium uptake protein TrkH
MFRSEVTRFYLLTVLVAAGAVTASLWLSHTCPSLGESARRGVFHTIAAATTSGFSTADTTLWTPLAMVILIYLIFQCGCAGSTSGGVKADRIYLAFKALNAQLVRQRHPNAVVRIKLNNVAQEQEVVDFAMFFIVLYVLAVVGGTVVATAAGLDLTTAFSMAAACMGNVGTGFGTVGTAADYAHIMPELKVLCTALMLLGRLEIFGLIQIFMIKW